MENGDHFELIAEISEDLRREYEGNSESDPWADSPFGWIKSRVSRQRGKIGEELLSHFFTKHGHVVTASGDSEADRKIDGHRVEMKFSTLWKTGLFKFQQIRDQNYAMVICLGLAPFKAYMWVLTKEQLHKHVIGFTPQHGGQAGRDTFWISVYPDDPEPWIARCGGTLGEGLAVFESIVGKTGE